MTTTQKHATIALLLEPGFLAIENVLLHGDETRAVRAVKDHQDRIQRELDQLREGEQP